MIVFTFTQSISLISRLISFNKRFAIRKITKNLIFGKIYIKSTRFHGNHGFPQKSLSVNPKHAVTYPPNLSANGHCVTEKSRALYFSTCHFATCRNSHSNSRSFKYTNYPWRMQTTYWKPLFHIIQMCCINLFFLNITAWRNKPYAKV